MWPEGTVRVATSRCRSCRQNPFSNGIGPDRVAENRAIARFMDTERCLEIVSNAISDTKGLEPVAIDIRERSSYADYMVICHGTSTAHARGISDKVEMAMKRCKVLPLGIEGYGESQWILLDYNTVVVHIFLEETRASYRLEELYRAADRLTEK